MPLTSLQVCMDSSDWLQGTINEETGMDSSSPSGGDMLTCSRPPLIERRLRPQHDQALKCPRCDSTHTKFCYYNNYSLSQPRYFCKTCRRYWTKGGTLRNIPVGGGCRKNKKQTVSNSKKSSGSENNNNDHPILTHSPTDLQLSFPEVHFPHLMGNHSPSGLISNGNFMDTKYNIFLDNPRPIDFKYEELGIELDNTATTNSTIIGHNFMGNGDHHHHLGMPSHHNGFGHDDHMQTTTFSSSSSFGINGMSSSFDGNDYNGAFMDTCHRLMLPPNYEGGSSHELGGGIEVKPDTKLLALEWQPDQGCGSSDINADKDHSFGYVNVGSLGSWTGLMNGYGSSATNPLV